MPDGLPISKPLLKRGGARNRADRTSWQLTERQCHKVLDASFAAWDAGMPLNRFITLAWGHGGIDAGDSVKATGKFVRLAREWMAARGYSMPWVWVQERGDSLGQHAHLLLSVPAELEPLFRPMPLRWTKSLLPQHYVRDTLDTQRLQFAHTANTEAYRAQLLGKLHYMLKCAPAALEGPLRMTGWGYTEWGQSCHVIGKRVGVWQTWKEAHGGLNGP
ncbi:MAG: hypothetical protein BGO57_01780 [Sphingomonadales bacterium 63-6]|nr:MAG: hypothetical protein BGO57_01780 [Sphingomonadales bacterium 63-6]